MPLDDSLYRPLMDDEIPTDDPPPSANDPNPDCHCSVCRDRRRDEQAARERELLRGSAREIQVGLRNTWSTTVDPMSIYETTELRPTRAFPLEDTDIPPEPDPIRRGSFGPSPGLAERMQRAREALDAERDARPVDPPYLQCEGPCGRTYYLDENMFNTRADGTVNQTCRDCRRTASLTRKRIAQNGRRFGVEIEFECMTHDSYYGDEALDPDVIADAMSAAGVSCVNDGYNHEVYESTWKIVSDASVQGGWELVSPPLYWRDRDQIKTVCRVLDELGAEATDACGLHVHHEVSDLSVPAFKRLVTNWHTCQPHTNRLVSRDRVGRTDWCNPFYPRELDAVNACNTLSDVRNLYLDRYKALNLTSYGKYGTVEIRQHQGTLDPNEIISWVAYGQAFVKAAASRRGAVKATRSPDELIEVLPIPEAEVPVLKAKVRPLQPRQPQMSRFRGE